MAMGSKTQTSKPHEIHQKTPICACSPEGKHTKKSGRCMLKSSKSDSTYCTIVYPTIHRNSAKIWLDTPTVNRRNETISMFRDQTFDSMLKWFTSFIQLIYSAARGRSSILFTFATFSCSAPKRGLLTLPCNQHGRNVTSSTRVASC